MARVNETIDRSLGDAQKRANDLSDATDAFGIAPTEDVAPRPTSYLDRLRHIHRKPPALPLGTDSGVRPDPMQAVIAPEMVHLGNAKVQDFAFAVAELTWRLEQPVASADTPALEEGHALLSQTARMYEHLFLLETGSEV